MTTEEAKQILIENKYIVEYIDAPTGTLLHAGFHLLVD